eukprot:CAMPEP_0119327250 /NCGR_PEP_ID=MMETSP1333-20130426/70266_1 /TAXON_ID=418940 /ORGANISM="Scyphosphaera apsteinii, Strain RCC1455" /LENGTH=1017 /DNA_ID=CAMNT_0007335785 /DNA_START=35 /DNA_END=3088 /DNA_ORIENTATION=+
MVRITLRCDATGRAVKVLVGEGTSCESLSALEDFARARLKCSAGPLKFLVDGADIDGMELLDKDDVVSVQREESTHQLIDGSPPNTQMFSKANSSELVQLQPSTTTDDYHIWVHGFALTASLFHCRDVLAVLAKSPCSTLHTLCERTNSNSGHLAVMLRTLSTVGWVSLVDGKYSTTYGAAKAAGSAILAELCADVYGELERPFVTESDMSAEAWGRHLPRLAKWLPFIHSGFELPAEATALDYLAKMLAGAVIAPLLLELRMLSSSYTAKAHEGKHEHASSKVSLAGVDDETANKVGSFFASQNWGSYNTSSKLLNLEEAGLFIVERCPAFGVCLSYRPMLNLLSKATFGSTAEVFKYESNHETWVDRKLNVIGSGFMHNRYFSDMMRTHVRKLFSDTPLAEQPLVVADMGCGDGTLLKTIYLYVKDHTVRGKHLSEHPLKMCGIDFNAASCDETSKTLRAAGVPHGTMFGDIGDPVPMQKALEETFEVSRDRVLHVRSFLDHDRPYVPPSKNGNADFVEAINAASDAVYVDNNYGTLISPAQVFYSLVEHWERWAACLGKQGLLVLEVSNLDVVSTRRFMNEATSMHFDCVQAHSGQMLMPATHFSLGAAMAGLLPSAGTLTYPKDSSYTRIVLQQLRPAGVSIRIATLEDMPQLLELEGFWKSDVLSASEATVAQRICAHPMGQYVVEAESGQLLASMYTQHVAAYESLLTAQRDTELDLHVANGPVVQLLGVVQRQGSPCFGGLSVGHLLRDFVLHLGRLDARIERACGVTRCRDYEVAQGKSFQSHVDNCKDAGLLFHKDAGAIIGELVPNYRPLDTKNLGFGVMICYEFTKHGHKPTDSMRASNHKVPAEETVNACGLPTSQTGYETLICSVMDELQYSGTDGKTWDVAAKQKAFMDLGIDSLDAVKFVQQLNAKLEPHAHLSSTIIFEYPDIRSLGKHLYNLMLPKINPAQAPSEELGSFPKRDTNKWKGPLIPWTYSEGLYEHRLELAQSQAKKPITLEMVDAALAMCH